MLTRFALSRPRIVLAAWLLATIALAFFAVQLPHDVKAGGFNNEHGPALQGQQLNEKAFHDPANELAVVVSSPTAITPDQVRTVEHAARSIEGVTSVTDATARPQLSSHDKRTQLVIVGFSSDNTATQNQVTPLREALTRATHGQSLKTSVTGGPALDYDLNMQSTEDAKHAEFIAFPLLIIVVLLVYRALGPTLLTLTVAGISLALTQGLGDLLARTFDISNMYVTGASLIGLAVSVDYCLFVLKRHQEFIESGYAPADAIQAATKTAGHAVRFGGTAVIAALCTLFIPRNMVFSSIAASGIIVTLLAITLTATFLPAAVVLLGRRTFWGKLPGFAAPARNRPSRTTSAALRAPGIIAATLAVALIALAAPLASLVLRVPVASASILPKTADSRVGVETMNGRLDSRALFPTTVTIKSDTLNGALAATRTIDAKARSLPSAASVTSAAQSPVAASKARTAVDASGTFKLGPTPLVTRYDNSYVSRVIVIANGSPDSAAAHQAVHDLRQASDRLPGAAYVSGATAQGTDFDDLVEKSVPWIVLSVAIVSLILLGFAFRSAWLPVIAIALNALVVAAAMGTLTFAWKAITGESINSVTPIVMFAIIFGLSMDYMVLMANRMKEEHMRLGNHRAAILEGSQRTARLVTSAAVIMIAVFLSFLVAKISIVRELGTGLAIAVFFDAFIVRSFLMPAVLAAVGDRVWGKQGQVSHPTPARRRESTLEGPQVA